MNYTNLIIYKDRGDLEAMMEALFVYVNQESRLERMSGYTKELVHNCMSFKRRITTMAPEEIDLLWQTVYYLLDELAGIDANELIDAKNVIHNKEHSLDGRYWIMPGVRGFAKCENHLEYAQSNRELFIKHLNIDGWEYMHHLHSAENDLLLMIMAAGGVRAVFKKMDSGKRVGFFQTSEISLSWLKSKIISMPLLKAVVKIVDPTKEYRGWDSGILFVLKK